MAISINAKFTNTAVRSITFDEAKRLFERQVREKAHLGQRNHKARRAAGKASHVQSVSTGGVSFPTQQLIQAVIHNVNKRLSPEELIDGYHRMTEWLENGCPFEQLLLVTYTVQADSLADVQDAADAMSRTIDSKKAVKGTGDFLTAAVLDAGMDPRSNAYKVGSRALTYFKRVLGNPEELTARTLKAQVLRQLDVHSVMDSLYAYTESRSAMSSKDATLYFHTGVACAIFDYLANRDGSISTVTTTLKNALAVASRSEAFPRDRASPAALAIGDALYSLGLPAKVKALKAGRNTEQFYTAYAEELTKALRTLDGELPPKLVVVR